MSLVFIFLLCLNSACQQGWIGNGTLCYKSFRSPKTWENAKEECEKWNASLVKIESREENDFVTQTDKSGDYWIGLSDSDTEDALTKSNTVLNVFLSYFGKLFLTCFVK